MALQPFSTIVIYFVLNVLITSKMYVMIILENKTLNLNFDFQILLSKLISDPNGHVFLVMAKESSMFIWNSTDPTLHTNDSP